LLLLNLEVGKISSVFLSKSSGKKVDNTTCSMNKWYLEACNHEVDDVCRKMGNCSADLKTPVLAIHLYTTRRLFIQFLFPFHFAKFRGKGHLLI
jgi:predicted membrane chloride channel (bestrophin family)